MIPLLLYEGVKRRSNGIPCIHWIRIDSNAWRRTISIRNARSKIVIMLNEVEKCETESTASVCRSGEVYKSGKCGM